jgi:hypothetical protein
VTEIVATRDRSVVSRGGDGTVRKTYRRPDPRNDVERRAYTHLNAFNEAPVPRMVSVDDSALVLEDIRPVGDFEAALRTSDAQRAAFELGRAYASLHEVAPMGAVTPPPIGTAGLRDWCQTVGVVPPDLARAEAAYDVPGPMLAFSHGDPAPSNALQRSDGSFAVIDFEYAGSRHRGYDIAAWHVLCPLEEALLDAIHAGYGTEIDGLDVLVTWRAAQVIGMVPVSVLDADREFAPGWSSRSAVLGAARRGRFTELHDALATRWPESVDRLPDWR